MSETPMVEAVAREPEMVRRVAEAMFEGYRRFINDTLGPDRASIPWAELDGTSMRCYCAAAREGIQAMSEPTEAQIKATSLRDWIGHPEANPGTIERWHAAQRRAAIRNWQAGIDAALAAPEEGRDP